MKFGGFILLFMWLVGYYLAKTTGEGDGLLWAFVCSVIWLLSLERRTR